MRNSTLCYIEKDGKYLMLHRTKKENDINKDKWIGVGGGVEENESPDECVCREVKEETGLTLLSYRLRGIVTFVSNEYESEIIFLYTADDFCGEICECDEGDLSFVDKELVMDLPTWEGDRIFLKELMLDRGFFNMKLRYEGDKLVESKVILETMRGDTY